MRCLFLIIILIPHYSYSCIIIDDTTDCSYMFVTEDLYGYNIKNIPDIQSRIKHISVIYINTQNSLGIISLHENGMVGLYLLLEYRAKFIDECTGTFIIDNIDYNDKTDYQYWKYITEENCGGSDLNITTEKIF